MATLAEDKKSQKWMIKQLEEKQDVDPIQLDLIKKKIIAGQKINFYSKNFLLTNYGIIIDSYEKSISQPKESTKNKQKNLLPLGQVIKKLKNFSTSQSMVPPRENSLKDNTPLQNIEKDNNSKRKINTQTHFEDGGITLKENQLQKQQSILLDDYEKNPTRNFESLGKTLRNIIKSSPPNFVLGIYGEWGIGKTTLMKTIEANLNKDLISKDESAILTIWFNAWKFERDKKPITHSLMKSMAFEMEGHKIFRSLAREIFSAIKIFDENDQSSQLFQFNAKNHEEFRKARIIKSRDQARIQKDSIYYNGISKIKNQIAQIRSDNGNNFRVVIFIDDLDRCSPDKTIELLESIKMLLEVEGFIFIVALSHDSVTKLITNVYNNTKINGEDYLKKIIQLPVTIPRWSSENFSELISQKIAPKLNDEYSKFVLQNPEILSQVANSNPRQLKRFINNVIIAFETFAKNEYSKITLGEMFLIKILKSEWPEFYQEIIKSEDFRIVILWLIKKPKEMKKYFNYLGSPGPEELVEQKQKRYSILVNILGSKNAILKNSQIKTLVDFDDNTWIFFENIKEIMHGIKDWQLIDRVVGVIEDIPYEINLRQKEQTSPTFQEN